MDGAYLFLRLGHCSPASGALIGHVLRLGIGTEFLRDLGTVVLHVQEVGGQGALWRVRVVGSALALLFLSRLRLDPRARVAVTKQAILQKAAGDAVASNTADVEVPTVQHRVCVVDVRAREIRDCRLERREAHNDLRVCQTQLFLIANPKKRANAGAGGVGQMSGTLDGQGEISPGEAHASRRCNATAGHIGAVKVGCKVQNRRARGSAIKEVHKRRVGRNECMEGIV